MRKIILLLMLSLGFAAYSQDCQPLVVNVYPQSYTCPEGVSIAVVVENISGIDQLLFEVINSSTNEMESQGVTLSGGETEMGLNFGPYPAGTVLRIQVIGFTSGGIQCLSEPTDYIVPSCEDTDLDNDGYNANQDCNDTDARVNPGATEICNRKDDNCNKEVDEGVNFIFYVDGDGDLYGDPSRPIASCNSSPTGYLVDDNTDCDDTDEFIYPGATEECDGVDNNCDGTVDEGCSCDDGDGDGVCDADDLCPGFDDAVDGDSDTIPDDCDNCPLLANLSQEPDADCDGVPTAEDCNDSDSNVITTNVNDADCDGVPSTIDCDDSDDTVTTTNIDDTDCDGVPTAEDCDDTNANIGSNANDADCDGVPTAEDCNDNDASVTVRIGDDTDIDGVLDCNDAEVNSQCPLNVDNRGISLDSDNDGALDCQDGCPGDRNKLEPGECGCQVQDSDTDGDGILDCNDQEVRSRCLIVDANGLSLDSDNDGVLDCDDLCPGFDDNLDMDKDKIPDGCDLDNTVRGVPICHVGNNGRSRTIYVSPQQKERHLAHGDEEGVCSTVNFSSDPRIFQNSISEEQVLIYPNPASTEVNIQIGDGFSVDAVLSISDLNGNRLMVIPMKGNFTMTIGLDNRFVPGIYLIVITDGDKQIASQFLVNN